MRLHMKKQTTKKKNLLYIAMNQGKSTKKNEPVLSYQSHSELETFFSFLNKYKKKIKKILPYFGEGHQNWKFETSGLNHQCSQK